MALIRKHRRKRLMTESVDPDKILREKDSDVGYILDYACASIPELYSRLSEIVDLSYNIKGGHNTGFTPETTSLVRIVSTERIVSAETVVAMAGYNSKKTIVGLRYIGGDPSFSFYKKAVEELCKAQIEYKNLNCFAEVSDAIEHYFARNGGDVIPNLYVHHIIGCTASRILEKEDDKIHYKRDFNAPELESGKRRLRKVLFGFGNDDMFTKIEKRIIVDFRDTDIQNYEDFKRLALDHLAEQHMQYKRNNSSRMFNRLKLCAYESAYADIDASNSPLEYILDVCRQYFNNFIEMYDVGYREFPKEVITQFKEIINIYEQAEGDSAETRKWISQCNKMLSNVTELTLIHFQI